jgi:hypothetical protein
MAYERGTRYTMHPKMDWVCLLPAKDQLTSFALSLTGSRERLGNRAVLLALSACSRKAASATRVHLPPIQPDQRSRSRLHWSK